METLSRVICDLHRDLKQIKATIPRSVDAQGVPQHPPSLNQTWDALNTKIAEAERILKVKAVEAIEACDKKNGRPTSPAGRSASGREPLQFEDARARYQMQDKTIKKRYTKKYRGRVVHDRTIGPMRLLPKVNRHDPSANRPHLGELDLDEGLLRLVNKGFVPHLADLTPAFLRGEPCVKIEQAPVYDMALKKQQQTGQPGPCGYPVRLDLTEPVYRPPVSAPNRNSSGQIGYPAAPFTAPGRKTSKTLPPLQKTAPLPEQSLVPYASQSTIPSQWGSPIASPKFARHSSHELLGNTFCTEVIDDASPRAQSPSTLERPVLPGDLVLRFGVVFSDMGRLRDSFQRNWSKIEAILGRMQYVLRNIPVAVVEVEKLVRLINRDGPPVRRVYAKPNTFAATSPYILDVELVLCCNNAASMVQELKKEIPGLRFRFGDKHASAVSYISATWKMYQHVKNYDTLRRRVIAAKIIQYRWKLMKVRWRTRRMIADRRQDRRKDFEKLQFSFFQSWTEVHGPRVEIHICSLSIEELRRGSIDNYQARQCQFGRIFRAATTGNQVVFVCSRPMHKDLQDYFFKVLAFRGLEKPEAKIQFIVPENTAGDNFPPNLSLTYALMYSPQALKRIQQLVRHQEHRAMFVFGSTITDAEMDLAVFTRIPIYGCDPKKIDLLHTKSAHKRLLTMANVPMPPLAIDIYDHSELYLHLASMVYEYPGISTWLIKIDDEMNSMGTAVLDVRPFQLANEDINVIHQVFQKQLSKRLQLPRGYPTFNAFINAVCTVGAIIQAMPEDIESYPTIHCRIDPNANISVLGTSESLLAISTEIISSFIPQSTLPNAPLVDMAYRVCRVLASKGVCGFVSIDCVVFQNPEFEERMDSGRPIMIGGEVPLEGDESMFAGLKSPSPELGYEYKSSGTPDFTELPVSRQHRILDALQNEHDQEDIEREDLNGMVTSGVRNRCPYALWVVDIDLGISQTMSMLWPLEFLGQLDRSPQTGNYTLASHAPTYTAASPQPRVALAIPLSLCPALGTMNCQNVFQRLKAHAQSYDLWSNMGALLVHLDVYSELFAGLILAPNRELASQRGIMLLQTLLVNGEPTRDTKELMVREILAALLTLRRRLHRENVSSKSSVRSRSKSGPVLHQTASF